MKIAVDACVPRQITEALKADGHEVTSAVPGDADRLILGAQGRSAGFW